MEQSIGKRIVEHRKKLGLTQDQLAEKLGVTAQAVSKWENDQSCPDISILPQLADIFSTSVDELLGRQAPVFQAEVVEPEADETEGIHLQNGNWEFRWDSGRKGALGFALFVLAVGALYLTSSLLQLEHSLWSILWPTALLSFGLFGLFPKFSFFRLGCTVLGGWFLADLYLAPQLQLDSGVIWAGMIILLGISLLADALRRSKKPKFRIHHKNKQNPTQSGKSRDNFSLGKDSFVFDASFGENVQYVSLPVLDSGEISCSFGEYTLDLSGVTAVSDDCRIDANCSFGELTIQVPRRFSVKSVSSTAFAEFSVSGQPDDHCDGTIRLDANCSFGEITVEYI